MIQVQSAGTGTGGRGFRLRGRESTRADLRPSLPAGDGERGPETTTPKFIDGRADDVAELQVQHLGEVADEDPRDVVDAVAAVATGQD